METPSNDRHAPFRAGDVVSDDEANRIYDGVVKCSLPKHEWTHPAHLIFATMLVSRSSLPGAEKSMPDMIRAYNESVGGVNNDREGYHHTITLFFLRRIASFLAKASSQGVGADATRLLASPLALPDYPLKFYSKERLFSVEARRNWVEPDLNPVDD